MTNISPLTILSLFLGFALPSMGMGSPPPIPEKTVMLQGGAAIGTIVLSEDASSSEQWAATELKNHFEQMSGTAIKIVTAPGVLPENAIILGNGKAAKSLGVVSDSEVLGTDGYVLKTVGTRLVIAESKKCGSLYRTYDVLEMPGCRWWYPGESTVPTLKTIELPVLDLTEIPALDYHDLLYGDTGRETDVAKLWRARNRMNGGMGGDYVFLRINPNADSEHLTRFPYKPSAIGCCETVRRA